MYKAPTNKEKKSKLQIVSFPSIFSAAKQSMRKPL